MLPKRPATIANITTYEKFKEIYHGLSGLDLNFYKEAQMKRRINSFMSLNGFPNDYTGFLIQVSKDDALFDSFFKHLTINVSQFFRDARLWESFRVDIIPEMLKTRNSLTLWSAGCSTGQEPYTMALILTEYFPQTRYSILASDIDVKVLEQAKAGIYNERDFASTPPSILAKYFTKVAPDKYQIHDALKKNITFKSQNLLTDTFPKDLNFIACRNVVIYFTDEAKDLLYRKFAQSLVQGGVLFTGSTEHIFGKTADLGLKSKVSFFYHKQ